MLNILIVYAVEEERVYVTMPNCKFHYCRTGVGKVAATIAVEHAINQHHPDIVINIGTAGTLDYQLGSIHLCRRFIDRDMEKLQNFGVSYEEDFTAEIEACGFFKHWQFDSICNTGDTFLTSADGTGDVFDMESFAVARVCRNHNIPFAGVKCVTDKIGQNSIKHWEEKLAEAQLNLQHFIDTNPLSVPENYTGRSASQIIDQLQLKQHPEGGWYKECYRSALSIKKEGLPDTFDGDRDALTSIYYLLSNQEISAFHRIQSPEIWYFHQGINLIIHIIHPSGQYEKVVLSGKKSNLWQFTVEPHCWFAAEIEGTYGYSLVSCAVAPGFDFRDFEMGSAINLIQKFPQHKDIINRMCKQ